VRTSDRARKCPRVTDVCCVDNRVSDPRTIRRSPLTDSNRRPPPYHAPDRQLVATGGTGFGLLKPFPGRFHLPLVAAGCDRSAP
jgi:hypothetical protein